MGRRRDTAALLRDSAERQKIIEAQPTAKRLAEELGPFKSCDVPTLTEEPDGKWELNMTSERATREENRRRIGVVDDALAKKRALETARSQRLAGEEHTVTIHDVRNGDVRQIAATDEDRIARTKKWARPGRRRRTYFFFGRAG